MKHVLLAACAAAILAVGTAAHAGTYIADFDSTSLDPSLQFYDPSGRFGEQTGLGLLTVAQSSKNAGTVGQGLVASYFAITGDFSAQITLNFAGLGDSGDAGTFSVNFGSVDNSSQMSGYVDDYGAHYGANFITNGVTDSHYYNITHTPYVDFRVDRVGDTVTQYISRGGEGGWIELNSETAAGFANDARFFFGLNNYQGSSNPGYIVYQNFQVTTPDAAPEPGTWALMFCGVGLAGAALRRHRAALPTAA